MLIEKCRNPRDDHYIGFDPRMDRKNEIWLLAFYSPYCIKSTVDFAPSDLCSLVTTRGGIIIGKFRIAYCNVSFATAFSSMRGLAI